MTNSKVRYLIPAFLFILGAWFTIDMIINLTAVVTPRTAFDFMQVPVRFDITFIMIIAVPALLIEYAIVAVPAAALLLVYASVVRAASYEINIMNIGTQFGGVRMVRRAVAPALFSLSSSAMLRGPIQNFIFGIDPIIPVGMELQFEIALSLMAALLFLIVSLAFFMPTWVLNDAGIVTHLRDDKLNIRQCPDIQGVGRWVGNILGGYALIAYPISAFMTHFYEPYIVAGLDPFDANNLINSLFWTFGLPFLVIAFILPVIAANEFNQKRIRRQLSKFAIRMGATVVLKPQLVRIDSEKALAARKREIKKEGILQTDEVAEIITSAKGIKKPKKNDKKKKKPAKKK
ncbi:MAG: hypothetical protein ACXADC_00115 [Candidatus Thorarchaeota archaeon]|jgi:hypothetical protein